jgi:hypothetical protein
MIHAEMCAICDAARLGKSIKFKPKAAETMAKMPVSMAKMPYRPISSHQVGSRGNFRRLSERPCGWRRRTRRWQISQRTTETTGSLSTTSWGTGRLRERPAPHPKSPAEGRQPNVGTGASQGRAPMRPHSPRTTRGSRNAGRCWLRGFLGRRPGASRAVGALTQREEPMKVHGRRPSLERKH